LYFLFAIQQIAIAQPGKAITIMDFVKIKEGKKAEAIYYYKNNWKLYREIALGKKVIQSYELVEAAPDSLNNFDLILITTYKDSVQYLQSEENFRPILAAARPNGPALLNEVQPADFRQNVFYKIATSVFSSGKRKRK
jgi:hypothetical protein